MTGEEVLERVRWYAGDRSIGHFIEINRALRDWCYLASLPWLREVQGGALIFRATQSVYPVGEFGLRRLDSIWAQASDSGRWHELDEYQVRDFELYVNNLTQDDGTTDTGRPAIYCFQGPACLAIRIAPTADKDYNGRVSGVANTPTVEWDKPLPGPEECHEHVALLAAGYHIEAEAARELRGADSEITVMRAQQLMSLARGKQAEATAKLREATREQLQNRLVDLKPIKTKLFR